MTLSDLPEIQIKRHVRATRLKLRVEPHQICLTVPVFCTHQQIQAFIDQSSAWMIETWQKQQVNVQEKALPKTLKLFNIEAEIQIVYQKQKSSFQWDSTLKTVFINEKQPEQYLKSFVIAYAKVYLPEYLLQVSHHVGLSYGKCNIRQAKTRWGSCSMRKDIMLNSALVLFPLESVRYVCIHELAHTQHFDHSPHFWAEVKKHDRLYLEHRKNLKNILLPYWWH